MNLTTFFWQIKALTKCEVHIGSRGRPKGTGKCTCPPFLLEDYWIQNNSSNASLVIERNHHIG